MHESWKFFFVPCVFGAKLSFSCPQKSFAAKSREEEEEKVKKKETTTENETKATTVTATTEKR